MLRVRWISDEYTQASIQYTIHDTMPMSKWLNRIYILLAFMILCRQHFHAHNSSSHKNNSFGNSNDAYVMLCEINKLITTKKKDEKYGKSESICTNVIWIARLSDDLTMTHSIFIINIFIQSIDWIENWNYMVNFILFLLVHYSYMSKNKSSHISVTLLWSNHAWQIAPYQHSSRAFGTKLLFNDFVCVYVL